MQKPIYYTFPAVFAFYADGVSVTFPDLPGCVSHGENQASAIKNAAECLALHLYGMESDAEAIPQASEIRDIHLSEGEALVLLSAFMPPVRNRTTFIKKTLTLPDWLNDLAVAQHVNFSQTLQNALKAELNIEEYNAK